MTTGAPVAPRFADCLLRATRYRFLHALLRPAAPGRQAELAVLAADLPGTPEDLFATSDEEVAVQAFRLLGPAGPVSLCASDYVRDGFADKGPFMADIAGFYDAFGFRPETGENVDHFSSLFAFLGFLRLKQAWALHDRDEEQALIAADAEAKLTGEYLHPYFERFAERLGELAPAGGVYAAVAVHLGEFAAD